MAAARPPTSAALYDLDRQVARLNQAIRSLSVQQIEDLQQQAADLGTGSGLRTQLAALAGMPTASMLSDMLAGRTPGVKYLPALAKLLGVTAAWLQGDDSEAPDWSMSPLAAWERFSGWIDRVWRRKYHPRPAGEDDSQSNVVLGTSDIHRVARVLKVADDTPGLEHLAVGGYSLAPFPLVVDFARALGIAVPSHPDHLRHGYESARLIDERIDQAVRRTRQRQQRYLLPPYLFRLVRDGLHRIRADPAQPTYDRRAVDDAFEMLWRQHLIRAGLSKREIPEGFHDDTGRGLWTPSAVIRQRYDDEAPPR